MHYYLLLYKLKCSNLIWIVKRDLHYYDLVDRIEKLDYLKSYNSDIDEYYIVKQSNCDQTTLETILELKQFTLFNLDRNSEILFKSE